MAVKIAYDEREGYTCDICQMKMEMVAEIPHPRGAIKLCQTCVREIDNLMVAVVQNQYARRIREQEKAKC